MTAILHIAAIVLSLLAILFCVLTRINLREAEKNYQEVFRSTQAAIGEKGLVLQSPEDCSVLATELQACVKAAELAISGLELMVSVWEVEHGERPREPADCAAVIRGAAVVGFPEDAAQALVAEMVVKGVCRYTDHKGEIETH